MRTWVFASMLLTTTAVAGPLPKGLKVAAKDGQVYASRDGLTLPIFDRDVADHDGFGALSSATLSDDGQTVSLKIETCSGGEDPVEVSLAAINARFANQRGMALHLKKKYAEAVVPFAEAVEADPMTPVYITNLLSAQSRGKLFDAADETLTTYGPKRRAWFGWRLAVDADLANVAGRPAAKALVAPTPSKLTYPQLGEAVAVSPLGLVAVQEFNFYGGPGAASGEDLAIYDLASGEQALRLTVIAVADACVDPAPGSDAMMMAQPCTAAMRRRADAGQREASRVLAILGFVKRPTTWVDAGDDVITSPDHTTVDFAHDQITRGAQHASLPSDFAPKRIAFAGDVVVLRGRENAVSHCDGDSQRSVSRAVQVK